MRHDPHLLVEGALLASFAMRAHACYIYVRGEFIREREQLQAAIDEAYAAKLIGKDNVHGWDFDLYRPPRRRRLHLRRGDRDAREPGGQEGQPRLKPPFPAKVGLYGAPDHRQQRRIDRRGAGHPAPRSGLVRRPRQAQQHRHQAVPDLRPREKPCVVEEEMGIPLRELIESIAGGVRGGWDNLLAVIPGGSSVPLHAGRAVQRLTMDFDALSKLKLGPRHRRA